MQERKMWHQNARVENEGPNKYGKPTNTRLYFIPVYKLMHAYMYTPNVIINSSKNLQVPKNIRNIQISNFSNIMDYLDKYICLHLLIST